MRKPVYLFLLGLDFDDQPTTRHMRTNTELAIAPLELFKLGEPSKHRTASHAIAGEAVPKVNQFMNQIK